MGIIVQNIGPAEAGAFGSDLAKAPKGETTRVSIGRPSGTTKLFGHNANGQVARAEILGKPRKLSIIPI